MQLTHSDLNNLTMMNSKKIQVLLLHLFTLSVISLSLETDTISSNLVIKDPDSIVSSKKVFKLGFYTPENTRNRYLGVFYTVSEKTVVWIANRDAPLHDSSSTVTISKDDGNLVLINGRNQTVWSTNLTMSSTNTTLQIQDTGNLLLRDGATGATLWESFSQPSQVFLPTMKIIDNTKTGKKVQVSSWKNAWDPEVGRFSAGLEALNIPQIVIWNNGRPHWRSGPWNGLILIGVQDMYSPYLDGFSVVNDGAGISYFTAPEGNFLMKIDLNSSGTLVQTLWDDQKQSWDTVWLAPQNECDVYGKCGVFGSCNSRDSRICSCLRGFEPVNGDEWDRGIWSSGCKRKRQLHCNAGNGHEFLRLRNMKVPDLAEHFASSQVDECRTTCFRNCSCVAYAHDATIGCMLWKHTLIDVQYFDKVGVDLYIRLSSSELGIINFALIPLVCLQFVFPIYSSFVSGSHNGEKLYITIPVVVGFVSIAISMFSAWYCMVKRKGKIVY